jgi:hypothetical protein
VFVPIQATRERSSGDPCGHSKNNKQQPSATTNNKQQQQQTMATTRVYKEEVLGKKCYIQFEVTGQGLVPFSGTIHGYKAELVMMVPPTPATDKNGTTTTTSTSSSSSSIVDRQHYIIFDEDDDKLWFDLQVETEESGSIGLGTTRK